MPFLDQFSEGAADYAAAPDFDAQFARSVLDVIRPYWAPQNALVWNGYRDVPFPFARIDAPKIEMEMFWTFPQLMARIHTWSATRKCMAERGNQFFEDAVRELSPCWGPISDQRRITTRLHLLAGSQR